MPHSARLARLCRLVEMARNPTQANRNDPEPVKRSRKSLFTEHRSLKALEAEALPGENLEDVMRRKCRAMVAHAKCFGWSGPPFDPLELASIHGIRVEATEDDIGGDGRIFPRRGDIVIQYRSGRMLERQRFTVCHELAHTCFSDAFEFVRHNAVADGDDPAHRKFENLCDVGAAELLMPHDEFFAELRANAICMAHMDHLRARYVASTEATLKRMLDCTDHPCAAVFLTDKAFKEFAGVPGKMRVQWMWKSDPFHGYLKPGTLAPTSSAALIRANETPKPFPTRRETWWINNNPRSWYVEAIHLPALPDVASYPKTVALLHARLPAK